MFGVSTFFTGLYSARRFWPVKLQGGARASGALCCIPYGNRICRQSFASLHRWSKDFGSVRPFEAGAKIGPHKGDMWGLGLLMRGMIWFLSDLDLLFVSFGEKTKEKTN